MFMKEGAFFMKVFLERGSALEHVHMYNIHVPEKSDKWSHLGFSPSFTFVSFRSFTAPSPLIRVGVISSFCFFSLSPQLDVFLIHLPQVIQLQWDARSYSIFPLPSECSFLPASWFSIIIKSSFLLEWREP